MNKEQTLSITGPQRANTFWRTWELANEIGVKCIIETGCWRGIDGDGQSTRYLSLLASELKADFYSVDIDENHVIASEKRMSDLGLTNVRHNIADSVWWLSIFRSPIQLLYLDSKDYEKNDPLPSQIHQVAEVGAALGKLGHKCIVLCDDCGLDHGGKGGLSGQYLLSKGYKRVMAEYQHLFVKM